MSNNYGPRIVTDGLVLCLDAADRNSYPGSGNTWYDLSGNGRDYTFDTNYVTYNSSKYFDVAYNDTAYNFIGPASNTFGFNSNMEHTIFCLLDIGNAYASNFFAWSATPSVGTDSRAIFTHFPWGSFLFYDVGGCCGGTQRLSSSTLGTTLTSGGFFNATWRTRTQSTPVKHIFKNGQVVLSGHTSTPTMTWDQTGAAGIANKWLGKIANFIVYNRALSDDEVTQNHNALKGRFGL
jgi:hypothetical protein